MSTAKDIMITNVITITKETPVRKAIELMLEKRISGFPVVSRELSLEGIISEKDLLQLAFSDTIDGITVEAFMTTEVISFEEDSDLFDICDYFINQNIKRVPILSENKLVGIISRKDMLQYILEM
ncbi:MAG: CBS domain-containing protein [Spirochaetota bacterium]|nr:CBS domain-containing protein [Spirochaetota bacterium]